MTSRIPLGPLILGLAGLLPFLWGALTALWPEMEAWAAQQIGPRFVAPHVQLFYGAVILSFMSGVLWGFATKSDSWLPYALSVVPALWVFFMTGGGPTAAATNLVTGFLGLLLLDWQFWRLGLAPAWWLSLRAGLTLVVVLSYVPLIF